VVTYAIADVKGLWKVVLDQLFMSGVVVSHVVE
jgi:hypothetical protein